MAEIVAGFGVPHTPMFPALVAREGPDSETAQLYRSVADHLRAVAPEVLAIFDSDHLNTFFLDNFPTLSVGLSDHTSGPNDGTPGLPRYSVPVSESLAGHLFTSGMERGFDLARTQEFEVDHSILVPLHFLTPDMRIPIVPIFINGIVHRYLRPSVAWHWASVSERRSSRYPTARGLPYWVAEASRSMWGGRSPHAGPTRACPIRTGHKPLSAICLRRRRTTC
jgi:hypothetical protein